MSATWLFILVGLPFSGKSTLARAMERRLGIAHVEVDRMHRRTDWTTSEVSPTRREWIDAYRASHARLEDLLRSGRSATFDAVGYRVLQRQRLRRLAASVGARPLSIYLDVPLAEIERRRERNRRRLDRPNVPESDFTMVQRDLQPPGDDEASVRFAGETPVEVWIDRVIAPMIGVS